MNVTFLIGNGFDLACGMKTRYSDVYEGYIKAPSATPIIEQFKADLIKEKTKENWGNWSDFEMGMAQYAEKFDNEQDFIDCVVDFRQFLKQHLLIQQERFNELWEHIHHVRYETLDNYINNCIFSYYRGISKGWIHELTKAPSFISFNYTDILDNVLKTSYPDEVTIHHIHGTLSDGDMILGIDNEKQINTLFQLSSKGKRTFIKPILNEEYAWETVQEIRELISDSDYICAFGLSFGDSDLMWKNAVIEWLRKDETHELFLYDYECSQMPIDDIVIRLNKEEDMKAIKLVEKGFCGVNDPIFKQIRLPIGVKLFDIEPLVKSIIEKAKKSA